MMVYPKPLEVDQVVLIQLQPQTTQLIITHLMEITGAMNFKIAANGKSSGMSKHKQNTGTTRTLEKQVGQNRTTIVSL